MQSMRKSKWLCHDGLKDTGIHTQKSSRIYWILDMVMPHMDCPGVLEGINDLELEQYPRTIVLFAVGQEQITQKAIGLGAEYYIVKPFNLDIF